MDRRLTTWNVGYTEDGSVPKPVRLWQKSVHCPGIYDLELDTSVLTPKECASLIHKRLRDDLPGAAFQCIADMPTEKD